MLDRAGRRPVSQGQGAGPQQRDFELSKISGARGHDNGVEEGKKTLAALARKCGIDADGLELAVADYKGLSDTGARDPFGNANEDIAPVRRGPFHAINLSIDAKLGVLPVLTLGGLTIAEESGAVLDGAGVPIAAPYAVGRTAVGICSNIYVSGLSVADCVFSGRRAAQSIAVA